MGTCPPLACIVVGSVVFVVMSGCLVGEETGPAPGARLLCTASARSVIEAATLAAKNLSVDARLVGLVGMEQTPSAACSAPGSQPVFGDGLAEEWRARFQAPEWHTELEVRVAANGTILELNWPEGGQYEDLPPRRQPVGPWNVDSFEIATRLQGNESWSQGRVRQDVIIQWALGAGPVWQVTMLATSTSFFCFTAAVDALTGDPVATAAPTGCHVYAEAHAASQPTNMTGRA